MGHPNTPQAFAYTQPRREKRPARRRAADGELGLINVGVNFPRAPSRFFPGTEVALSRSLCLSSLQTA